MWSFAKLLVLFVLATVLHWAFASLFSFWAMSVNMMLAFTVAFCAVLKPAFGYPLAFLCGLFLDFFGTKLFGNNAFTFTLSACLVYQLAKRFDFDGFSPQIVTVFFLTLLVGAMNSLLVLWFTSSVAWVGFWNWFGGAFVTAIFSPLVFLLVRVMLGKGAVRR